MGCIPPKTQMTLENQPFEDVYPMKNGDFPLLVLGGGKSSLCCHPNKILYFVG